MERGTRLKVSELNSIFASLDRDESGSVDLEETVVWVKSKLGMMADPEETAIIMVDDIEKQQPPGTETVEFQHKTATVQAADWLDSDEFPEPGPREPILLVLPGRKRQQELFSKHARMRATILNVDTDMPDDSGGNRDAAEDTAEDTAQHQPISPLHLMCFDNAVAAVGELWPALLPRCSHECKESGKTVAANRPLRWAYAAAGPDESGWLGRREFSRLLAATVELNNLWPKLDTIQTPESSNRLPEGWGKEDSAHGPLQPPSDCDSLGPVEFAAAADAVGLPLKVEFRSYLVHV
eukprot:SAG31_NODE_2334_length_5929_cov_1.453516_3_plen_295_part_00